MRAKEETNKRNKNNNLIGFAVLGVGALALIFIFYIVYQKLNGVEGSSPLNSTKASQTVPNRAAGEKPKVIYKRQADISEADIKNSWETFLKDGRALLEIGRGKYKLIVIPDNKSGANYYSYGTYTMEEDLIILSPDLNKSPPKAGRKTYTLLTRSQMPVVAVIYKGQLVWQVPPSDSSVYVPPYHPILSRTKDKIVVWSVLE